ncbi:MAG: right-handed parallel beta-helix repeat-containing protein, partial [Planctomycetota bacterium]
GLADGVGSGPQSRGAGIYGVDASPRLENLIIIQCDANQPGSAIHLRGTTTQTADIFDCQIVDNTGEVAVWATVSVFIDDSVFSGNECVSVQLEGDTFSSIARTRFSGNVSSNRQGTVVIAMDSGSSFTEIADCEFISNSARAAGGIYYIGRGDHELRGTTLRRNTCVLSTIGGGAVYLNLDQPTDSVTIENSLLIGNTAPGEGGAITKDGQSVLAIVGSTITGNIVPIPIAAAISSSGGSLVLSNSIVSGNINSPANNNERGQIFVPTPATASADRCIIQALGAGPAANINATNSTSADPMFVDANGGDDIFGTGDDNVRLMPGSPAIDAGNNLYVGPLVLGDIYNQPRFADDTGTPDTGVDGGLPPIVDIGAAEFQGTTPGACVADTNGDGLLTPTDFNGWIIAFNAQAPACDQNGDDPAVEVRGGQQPVAVGVRD